MSRSKNMSRLDTVINQAKRLNPDELKVVSEEILHILKLVNNDSETTTVVVDSCRRCESKNIVKFGKDKNGKQRYKCRNCGSTFTETSYSVISNTHCDINTWRKYVELLLNGSSLQKCSEECKISVRTAFIWRHKILNALQKDQENRALSGIIEVDETFISISYKGNHNNSKNFTMPRAPYKRGTDSRAQTGSRACVMVAHERNGQTYGEVLGKGQPTIAMLSHAFDNRIIPDSIVISDKAVGIKNYFSRFDNIDLVQLMAHIRPKSMSSPPEVKGIYHIQNVNNLHNRFHRFLRGYNGVSTKYLNHYVNLFIWIENYKKIENTNLKTELLSYITSSNTHANTSDILALPAIPVVA